MDYLSVIKRKLFDTTTWIKLEDTEPITEGQILHYSTYMRNLKQSSLSNQKVERCLPGAGRKENEELVLNGYEL